MKPPRLRLFLLVIATVPFRLTAQTPGPSTPTTPPPAAPADVAPLNKAGMLADLAKLSERAEGLSTTSSSQLIAKLKQAASSTTASWALYQEAIKITRFSGETKENTQFRDWKKKEEPKLEDPGFRGAIPFHLQYLALTLERASGIKTEALIPEMLAYATSLQAAPEEVRQNKELMQSPISSSLFVKWFQVDLWVSQAKDWEPVPGNLEGMMEKTVLPWWREQHSMKAVEYWDGRISRETLALADDKRDFPKERFENLRRPTLLWSRASEFAKIGMPNKGATEMYAVLQKYPGHPEFPQWAIELTKLLKPAATDVVAAAPGGDS